MGWISMCERDLKRIEVLSDVRAGAWAYERKQIILERSELADKLPGQYVEVYDFADRPLELRWKGHSLPYRVFSKDQRVSHTVTVENKRLVTHSRSSRPSRRPSVSPRCLTNSDKGGYQKRGRQLYGPDYVENVPAPKAVEMQNRQKRRFHSFPQHDGYYLSEGPILTFLTGSPP